MHLVVTDRARRDAQSITRYYKREVGSADWFLRKLSAATEHLLLWPLSGERRVDIDGLGRMWLVGPYYLIYRVDRDMLTLLAIIHTSRDMTQALKGTR